MILSALVASVILSNPPACSGQTCDMQMPETLAGARSSAPKDIVVVASEAGDFGTLIAAAKAAGLVGVLQSEGPITVFAPTDAAFAKLPKGTVETLLKPENKKALVEILTYHVVPGKLEAADVLKKKYPRHREWRTSQDRDEERQAHHRRCEHRRHRRRGLQRRDSRHRRRHDSRAA